MQLGAHQTCLGAAVLVALAVVSGCDLPDDETDPTATIAPGPVAEHRAASEVHALRWLPGFGASAISEHPSRSAGERLEALRSAEDACRGAGTATFAVVADVAPSDGDETVLASVAQGIAIADAHEHMLAAVPLADCGGSADEMVALAVGDAWIGEPVIAVIATVGGHRESETEVSLFTLGDHHHLDRIFSGVIEERDGGPVREGAVIVIPGAIFQRSLDGITHLLVFDPATRRFAEHVHE